MQRILQGTVIKSTGSWYTVRDQHGESHDCRIKGKFRIKGFSTTNPVAVGDHVEFDPGSCVISHLHDRRNYIIRRATNLSRQAHIIAANIDQAVLIVTLAQPRTSFGFIDRFLVTAEAYSIPALLVFNKIDIYTEEGKEMLDEIIAVYTEAGYPCLTVSALEGTRLDELRELLAEKTSLLAGHSGAGKSTLINKLIPGMDLKTANISGFSGKGTHTTTFAEMYELPPAGAPAEKAGGYIIDTPGIREFGIFDIPPEELSHYFPEMRERFNQCKFDNCRHLNEPGCAIVKAVEKEEIALSRYESYLSMYENFDTRA